jgi:hypothetical protein
MTSTKLPETASGLPIKSPHDVDEEDNPFKARDWRMFLYAWTGFALRVLLCVGAVFSALQYMQSRHEARIGRTLSLVELWERPEYQDAQRAVKRRLAVLADRTASMITEKTTDAELDIIMSSIGLQAMSAEGGTLPIEEFEEKFERVAYFLGRLGSCVEGNLCDRKVADEFFLDFARSFWRYFAGHIERERGRGSPTFASAIESYVNAAR